MDNSFLATEIERLSQIGDEDYSGKTKLISACIRKLEEYLNTQVYEKRGQRFAFVAKGSFVKTDRYKKPEDTAEKIDFEEIFFGVIDARAKKLHEEDISGHYLSFGIPVSKSYIFSNGKKITENILKHVYLHYVTINRPSWSVEDLLRKFLPEGLMTKSSSLPRAEVALYLGNADFEKFLAICSEKEQAKIKKKLSL